MQMQGLQPSANSATGQIFDLNLIDMSNAAVVVNWESQQVVLQVPLGPLGSGAIHPPTKGAPLQQVASSSGSSSGSRTAPVKSSNKVCPVDGQPARPIPIALPRTHQVRHRDALLSHPQTARRTGQPVRESGVRAAPYSKPEKVPKAEKVKAEKVKAEKVKAEKVKAEKVKTEKTKKSSSSAGSIKMARMPAPEKRSDNIRGTDESIHYWLSKYHVKLVSPHEDCVPERNDVFVHHYTGSDGRPLYQLWLAVPDDGVDGQYKWKRVRPGICHPDGGKLEKRVLYVGKDGKPRWLLNSSVRKLKREMMKHNEDAMDTSE